MPAYPETLPTTISLDILITRKIIIHCKSKNKTSNFSSNLTK